MLAGDGKNTVLSEAGPGSVNDFAYSAYGHRSEEQTGSTCLGYNGQLKEAHTGCYLLGNGYRAFSPVLMRFHSPDSWSPFGEGGLNAYMYALGDPVAYKDPTGHSAWGAIVRAVTFTTKSSGAERIPAGLKLLGSTKKTSARLFKITPENVANSRNKKDFFLSNVESLDKKISSTQQQLGRTRNPVYQQTLKSDLRQFNKSHESEIAKHVSAREEYRFLKENVGKKGITRHSSDDLATYAPRPPTSQDGHQQYLRSLEIQPPSQLAFQQRQNVREIRGKSERKTLGVNPD